MIFCAFFVRRKCILMRQSVYLLCKYPSMARCLALDLVFLEELQSLAFVGTDASAFIRLESAAFLFHMMSRSVETIGSSRAACSLALQWASGLPLSANPRMALPNTRVP